MYFFFFNSLNVLFYVEQIVEPYWFFITTIPSSGQIRVTPGGNIFAEYSGTSLNDIISKVIMEGRFTVVEIK